MGPNDYWTLTRGGVMSYMHQVNSETVREDRIRVSRRHVLWGAVVGGVLAVIIGQAGAGPFWGAVLVFPLMGGIMGWISSPEATAWRQHNEAEAEKKRLVERTSDQVYKEELDKNDPSRNQWRARVHEALRWWSTEGYLITTQPDYLVAVARNNPHPALSNVARYRNSQDPLATRARAEEIAAWALLNLPEDITDHIKQEPEKYRTVHGVADILRLYRRRDIMLEEEATAYHLGTLVERYRDEDPLKYFQRLVKKSRRVASSLRSARDANNADFSDGKISADEQAAAERALNAAAEVEMSSLASGDAESKTW